jgi:[acyl-carrier-protein] S-malonyltransferase
MASATKTAWLFPGQGSQFVGMGRDLCGQFRPAAQIFEKCSELSGLPLGDYCWHGPEQVLARTDILQPAITAVNLGSVALLRDAGFVPDMVAGHSLGEFSALHAAGVLSLEDTVHAVVERGRLMHEAAQQTDGKMLAVKNLDAGQVEAMVAAISGRATLCVANYNAPTQTVLAGDAAALAAVESQVRALGGEPVYLNVSGAWHSPYMASAAARFARVLDGLTFHPPRCPIALNVTGAFESDPRRIKEHMAEQIVRPVRWTQTVQALIGQGVDAYVEVGVGKVLRGLLRRIYWPSDAYSACGVDSPQSLRFLRRPLAKAAS